MISDKGSLFRDGLNRGRLSQAQAIFGVSRVWPLKAFLEVETGLGLGQFEVVLGLLPLAVPHPPELCQLTF